ncbi:MAG: hypothetical protein EHM79_08230 [Geobacter sp.]|nr:MAG: hypothetical protein EHM79_08230 [Geobacter sp.]
MEITIRELEDLTARAVKKFGYSDDEARAISFYGMVEASTAGSEIPGDVAYDSEGKPTTNPKEAIQGAIRSFDRNHKGSGLALMNEILAGPLVGAAFCGLGDSKGNWGHLLYALDPEILGDREEFKRNAGEIIARVKGTKKLPGVEEIFVPGERGSRRARQHLESGTIEIEDNLLAELRVAAGGEKG